MRPLSCLLDVPPAFAPKARYALGELLRPLGLTPSFEGGDGAALYYGTDPARAAARVALRCAPETAAWFDVPRPLAPARVAWLDWDGDRWPVPIHAPVHAESGDAFGGLDLIASAFWWLSGWQEAAARQRDVHGRFPYAASLQAALGTAHLPAVDAYRCALAEALAAGGVAVRRPAWGPEGRPWAVLLSHDVDRVRRRRLGALARGLRAGAPADALRQALAQGNVDLEGLAALLHEAERRGARATLFAKAGRTGRLDAPYRLGPAARRLLRRAAAAGHGVGLHPSTFAMRHAGHLAAERRRLEHALGAPTELVRAHFLRFDPLRSPGDLAAQGFQADASLGFSAAPGYRRGTGQAFRLWDLRQNAPAPLWEVPLAVMDTTLLDHQAMAPEEAADAARRVLAGARRTGSAATLLWHNRPLDEPAGRAALAAYRRVLDDAQAAGAALLPLGAALLPLGAALLPLDAALPGPPGAPSPKTRRPR